MGVEKEPVMESNTPSATQPETDLARALVGHPRFRWVSGLVTVPNPEYGVSGRAPTTWVIPVSDGGLVDVGQHYQRKGPFASALGQVVPGEGLGCRMPDLGSPATAGQLLDWLMKADPSMHLHRDGSGYIVHVAPGICEHVGATLGEAVAKALLAVWGPA